MLIANCNAWDRHYHRLLWRENKAKGGCRLTIDILDKDALAGSWQLTKILALR